MIKHEGGKWILYTKDGSKKLGTHDTEGEAQAQERAIEASKHRAAGDVAGHEFHGNQHVQASASSTAAHEASAIANETNTSGEHLVAGGRHGVAYAHHLVIGNTEKAALHQKLSKEHYNKAAGQYARGAEESRQLHLRGALGAVRTELVDGREHLVVPCVALQEGVIHAVNAETPEFVSAKVLAASHKDWHGHPLVLGHPVKDGKQISAHDPLVLEKHCFGTIRAPYMKDTRLGLEALVDPARLELLGQKQLLADLRAGKPIEVSVGAFVRTNGTAGTHNGKTYKAEWTEITPDHFAFLPNGVGACSLAAGCGAHRAAECTYLVTAEGFEALSNPEGINQYTHGAGLASHESIHDVVAVHDQGKTFHNVVVESKWKLGKGSKRSPELLGKKAALTAKGWNVEHATKGDSKMTHFKSPWGHSKEQAIAEFRSASNPEAHGNYKEGHVPVQPPNSYAKVQYYHPSDLAHERDTKGFKAKGLSMSNLKARILALFDTPEEAASEEAAELIAYNTMRTLFDGVGKQYDEASGLIDELIADEDENPTETPAQEDAETEVEGARLEAIRMLCYSMISALQNVVTVTYEETNAPDLPVAPSDPRYMEEFRAAFGKAISAKNMKVIQAAHDSAHSMHDHTTGLGAECNGMKLLAQKDCPTCEGLGQITTDGKQADCAACDGSGAMKAAASTLQEAADSPQEAADSPQLKAACRCEESTMDKKVKAELIAALVTNKHSGFKEGDEPFLETASDKRLEEFRAAAEANKAEAEAKIKTENELRSATAKLTVIEGKLKVAEQAPTEEEWLGKAPAGIKVLLENQKAQEAELREGLIKELKVAGANTEDELKAMPTTQLQTLAKYAKVQAPDFSGRGIPVPRNAKEESFAPPNPYEAGIKALQEQDKLAKTAVN